MARVVMLMCDDKLCFASGLQALRDSGADGWGFLGSAILN